MFSEYIIIFFYVILVINFFGIAVVSSLRIYFIQRSSGSNFKQLDSDEPFVSIHFAICDEPVDMVLDTLQSFEALNYSNYEIIIISNNTSNRNSWKPIEIFSQTRSFIKFFHFDKLDGFKAGALNIALEKMDVKADYVFTVDADYKLHPDALKIAVGTIRNRDLDVLQFPQDYENVCCNTQGLQANYKHYFECYLSAMDIEKFGLPTGTLTMIDTKVFKDGQSWPTETITEDAHFGVELLSNDFKIGYCGKSIGKGIMPTNVSDYMKQLKRWIFGNFQTLIASLSNREISVSNKIRLFTMLSAWINFLAVPISVTFLLIPFVIAGSKDLEFVYYIIFISLLLHLLTQWYILSVTSKYNIRRTIYAMLVHIGTLEIGSFQWLSYFINSTRPFIRTNKYLTKNKLSISFFFVPLVLTAVSIICMLNDAKFIGISLLGISIIGLLGKLQLVKELYFSKFNLFNLDNV